MIYVTEFTLWKPGKFQVHVKGFYSINESLVLEKRGEKADKIKMLRVGAISDTHQILWNETSNGTISCLKILLPRRIQRIWRFRRSRQNLSTAKRPFGRKATIGFPFQKTRDSCLVMCAEIWSETMLMQFTLI